MGAVSLILFLLGLATFTNSETCPESNLLYPCACEEDKATGIILVDCAYEGTYDKANLRQLLNSLSEKERVDLKFTDFDLGSLYPNYFYGIRVKKLEIANCKLDSLTDNPDYRPLLGLEDDLEDLVIVSSIKEENFPFVLKLGHLRMLKELDLSFNSITELSNDWFDRGPASLEFLLISDNGFQKVGDRAFANVINLKQLSFNGNRFGSIQRSMLPYPAARLEKLELNNNGFTSIPEDLFSNMPVLRGIALRENGLLKLDQRTWQPVWQRIKYVTLEGNPIECDSRLNWIFKIKKTPAIYGKCNAPVGLEGQTLRDLIDSRKEIFLSKWEKYL